MSDAVLVSGFGSIVVDVLMRTESIQPDSKNPVSQQLVQVGGVVPTALIVLSRLGIATQFHSTVGDDLFGTALENILNKEGVGTKHLIRAQGQQTPFAAVIIHQATGKRTSFYSTGSFSHTDSNGFHHIDPTSSFLLIDAHNPDVSRLHMEKARKAGTMIMLDLGNPKPGMEALFPLADGLIVPQAYWKVMWKDGNPTQIAASMLKLGPKLIVLTMEEKGCIVATPAETFHQPSYAIDAKDTNGAGDVFFGSFVYGLTQKWDLHKAAMFASGAAARSCTLIGKDKKIPRSADEVFTFIATASPSV